jgi:hypothetical protein
VFLKDLEPYRYGVPAPLKDVLAIGWLSKINGYTQDAAPAGFVGALAHSALDASRQPDARISPSHLRPGSWWTRLPKQPHCEIRNVTV